MRQMLQHIRSGSPLVIIPLLAVIALSCGGPEQKKLKYLDKGKELYKAGDYAKARLELKNALQIDPEFLDAYYYLGLVAVKQRDIKKAYKYFSKAIDLDPQHLNSQQQLARLFLAGKAIKRAREKVELILTQDPENSAGLMLKAAVLLAEKKIPESLDLLEKLRTGGNTDPQLYLMLASIFAQKKNNQATEDTLLNGITANPSSTLLYTRLSGFYATNNLFREAVANLQKAIDLEPDNPAHHLNLAELYWISDQKNMARDTLGRLASADPLNEDNIIRGARFYISKQEFALAEQLLIKGIAGYKKGFKLRLQLGELYLNIDKIDQAIDILTESLSLAKDPANPGIIQTKNALAKIYFLKRDLESAEKYVQEVLVENPLSVEGHFIRGSIFLMRGEGVNAVSEFRTVV
ncbi:MAG: tetratricopeptide repeat protein, partial [Desulfobacterales bacterium]